MISEEAPILANALNRIIFIDKEEYVLSYKHQLIESYSNAFISSVDLGKFYLTKKNPNKDGNIIQYVSEDKILARDTVNQNVLNNDKFLINKIVQILEGNLNYNENFKIEENKMFKIVLNMKNGISLILFTCNIKMKNLKDYSEAFLVLMKYFNNKLKLNEALEIDLNNKNTKCDVVAKKYSNLSRTIGLSENEFLNNICNKLNDKKQKIRTLQKEIDGDVDELQVEKEENKLNTSFKKPEEDLNQSQTYSLSDLI